MRRRSKVRAGPDRIRSLAADIPSLWNAADTPAVDRKEIVRALVERVTVTVHDNTEHATLGIEWIGGATTEHSLRRTISSYQRLRDFARMRSLVEASVATGQTSEQIAEYLNREAFRPVSNREDRFTPSRARELVYRLGLSPRCRPAEPLRPEEWWVRDLADKLGVSYHRFKDWVKKDYVHFRKVCRRGNLVIWAYAEERERLGRFTASVADELVTSVGHGPTGDQRPSAPSSLGALRFVNSRIRVSSLPPASTE